MVYQLNGQTEVTDENTDQRGNNRSTTHYVDSVASESSNMNLHEIRKGQVETLAKFYKGLFFGLLFSAPIWGLILWFVL